MTNAKAQGGTRNLVVVPFSAESLNGVPKAFTACGEQALNLPWRFVLEWRDMALEERKLTRNYIINDFAAAEQGW